MSEFAVDNPATGEIIAYVDDATAREAIQAVEKAHARQPAWAALPPRSRSEILYKTRELIIRDGEKLAQLIHDENGKTLADAKAEVSYAAEFFRWYAEEAVRPHGDFGAPPAGGTRTVVTSRPVGVAALVTPWNFPAAMATRKIAPALAAGCTVVLKPAAETPLTALAIGKLIEEAGAPEGVVNVVCTTDPEAVVGTWLGDDRVRKISFTGSTRVGRHLLKQAADRVVNASMELGGNAPFVVTETADLQKAVEGALIAKFRNGGQACTAANTFWVHEGVAEEFTAKLIAGSKSLEIGPMISKRAVEGIAALVDGAVAEGAVVAHRGETGPGYAYPLTVLTNVRGDQAIVKNEIFGPVAPIVSYRDVNELVETLNGSEFGLAAYVYADLGKALKLAERLEIGMVGINRGLVSDPAAPFGGTKQSGLGREGARVGIEEYLETQYFSVAW